MRCVDAPSFQPDGTGSRQGVEPLFEMASDLLCVVDKSGALRRVSRSATELLGYSEEELAGVSVLGLAHPKDLANLTRFLHSISDHPRGAVIQTRLRAKDGHYRRFAWSAWNPPGDELIYAIARDVTLEHLQQQSVEQSEERFGLAVRGAGDGIWDVRSLSSDELWGSAKLYEMIGRDPAAGMLSVRGVLRLMPVADRRRVLRAVRLHFRCDDRFTVECRIATPSGLRWFRVSGQAVFGNCGQPRRMAGSLSDIHDLKSALERLKFSESMLQQTSAIARIGSWRLDLRTNQPFWSPEIYRIYGLPPARQPLLIPEALSYFEPEARLLLVEALEQAIRNGAHWDLELPLLAADGVRRCVRTMGRPDFEDGKAVRLWGSLQDITERKQAEDRLTGYLAEVEEARQLLEQRTSQLARQAADLAVAREAAEQSARVKSSFLANMSHKIRTPMNGILGMAALLSETPLSEEQQEYVHAIRQSGDALMGILNDILDFSKIDAGKVELEQAPFDLPACVEGAVDLMAERAFGKGVDLAVYIDPAVPGRAVGDGGRLRQILLNLLTNAVKFTDSGEVACWVTCVGNRDRISFEVRDTGIGIRRSAVPKLFQPFIQADAGTTRRFGGTGLGLAISKELAEAMGGSIEVVSTPGEGSTFRLELSLKPDPGQQGAAAAPPAPAGGAAIALVGPATARALSALLADWGWPVLEAPDRERLRTLQSCGLALIDADFDDGRGLEAARELRKSHPEARLAILVRPGCIETAEAARALGFWALRKPLRPSRLLQLLAPPEAESVKSGIAGGDDVALAPAMPAVRPGMRVLVAEDNVVNQRVVQKMLSRIGCEATVVGNGRAAVEQALAGDYELVLMDCQMPEMDGFAATRAIRAKLAPRRLPIVALTANAMQGDRERCLEAGMDDYLTKPMDIHQLADALNRWASAEDQTELQRAKRILEA